MGKEKIGSGYFTGSMRKAPQGSSYRKTLSREAPETLASPRASQFKDLGSFLNANQRYKKYGNWASYKKGGKVRKTGLALVHKGERVLTVKQAKKYKKK